MTHINLLHSFTITIVISPKLNLFVMLQLMPYSLPNCELLILFYLFRFVAGQQVAGSPGLSEQQTCTANASVIAKHRLCVQPGRIWHSVIYSY